MFWTRCGVNNERVCESHDDLKRSLDMWSGLWGRRLGRKKQGKLTALPHFFSVLLLSYIWILSFTSEAEPSGKQNWTRRVFTAQGLDRSSIHHSGTVVWSGGFLNPLDVAVPPPANSQNHGLTGTTFLSCIVLNNDQSSRNSELICSAVVFVTILALMSNQSSCICKVLNHNQWRLEALENKIMMKCIIIPCSLAIGGWIVFQMSY